MDAPLLTVRQAIQIIDSTPATPRIIKTTLDQSLSHNLAEDIYSDRDYPPFNKSVMDGFAIRSGDSGVGVTLRIIETIPAGSTAHRPLGHQEAAAIMTGAPVPLGADAVIPVEQTTRKDKDHVTLNSAVSLGFAIAAQASDTKANQLLLPRGTHLGPAQLAVAASVGAHMLCVFARPEVSILSTGDELIEIDQTPAGSQIRNSNSHMMLALLNRLGCEVQNLGIACDDPAVIRDAINRGLESDALFITGGMSMGERDYVPQLLRDLGLELLITKLRIKPGKPFVFAIDKRHSPPRYVFGLPGNPVSAYVCTIRLAARLLSRLAGGPLDPYLFELNLTSPLPANGPREFYQPAVREGSTVMPLDWKSSADIYTLAMANALIIRAENAPAAEAGDPVQVLDLVHLS